MADNVSSIVVSFGAAVDDKTFKQSLTRLRNFMAEFATEMKKSRPKANTQVFDDFVAKADEALGKKGRLSKTIKEGLVDSFNALKGDKGVKVALDKQAKEIEAGNAAILAKEKEANKKREDERKRALEAQKKNTKDVQDEAKKYVEAAANAAAQSAEPRKKKGAITSPTGSSGIDVLLEGGTLAADLSVFEKRLKKVKDSFESEIENSPYLKKVYGATIGRAESTGQVSALMAAEQEYKKYAAAAFKFEKVGGGKFGFNANTADFDRIFQAISDKSIRFDKDIGFFSTNFQVAAKALGITVDGFLAIQNKMNQGVDILGKIKMFDAKYGTTGIDSAKSLQKTYTDANVYSPTLFKAMKAEQQPWFQKLGVMGDTTAVANAAIQGNIDLTNKSLKINNELGLKALKIDEDRAIKLGLLSKEYGGNAYQIQNLTKDINKLSPEYKKVFDILNTNMKDPASIKRSLDVVKWTAEEVARLRDAGKAVDMMTIALEKQQQKLDGKKTATGKPKLSDFDKTYNSQLFASPAAKNALDQYAEVWASKLSPEMKRALPVFKAVENEVQRQALALKVAGKDGDFFAATFDRVTAVNRMLANELKITSKGFQTVAEQLNPLEKLMLKYNGSSEQLRQSILKVAQSEEVGTKSFRAKVTALEAQEKKILDTIEKMKALGKTEQEILTFRGTADPMALAFNARSDAARKSTETMKEVAAEYKKTEHHASLLGRAIKDLYEKFKILAGYAISGSIAYGIGNAIKSAIVGVIQYDQALKDLQAVTQATSFETERMGEKIKEVATKTKFSVIEVADGMKVLGQAGLTASESIEAIMPIAELATATLSDFGTINDLVSSALGAFDLQATDTGKVVDVFGAAINRSKLDVEKLRVAMNYVGPVAHDAGLSLEEVVAGMGLFANAGIRASTIGTAFRQIISQLMTPSKEFAEAIKMAGYSLEEMNPKTNDFSEIITKLVDIVPDAENAFKFFGQRGASAVSVLTKAGKEGFEEMTKQMGRIGTVSEMAAKQLEGMAVIAKQTKDTLQVMSLESSKVVGVTDGLRIALTFLRDTLQDVRYVLGGNGVAIMEWVGFISLAVLGVTALSGAFSGLAKTVIGASILGSLGTLFSNIAAAAITAGTAVSAFFGALTPIGWAITAVVGLTAVWKAYDLIVGESAKTTEDIIREMSRQIELQKQETKQYELKKQYVEDLISVMKDESKSLDERKHALVLLIKEGVNLDSSIVSNINNVEQFNTVLKNSEGALDSYKNKLAGLAEASRGTVLRLFQDRAKIAEQNMRRIEKEREVGVLATETINELGVSDSFNVPERDPEKIAAQQKKWADEYESSRRDFEEYKSMILGSFENMLKEDEKFAEALIAIKANNPTKDTEETLNRFFDDMSKRYSLDPKYTEQLTKAYVNDETSWNSIYSAIKKYSHNSLERVKQVANPKESSELAVINIQNAVRMQENQKAVQDQLLNNLREKGASESVILEEVDRISKVNEELSSQTKKTVQDNLEIVKNNIEEEITAQEEIKRQQVANAKRIAAETGGTAAARKAEQTELQAELELAQYRFDKYEYLAKLAEQSGIAKEKYGRQINSLQQKAITDLEEAKTNFATGMSSLDKKDQQAYERELAERLKRLQKVYDLQKEEFNAKEADELAENAIKNHNSVRTEKEEDYRIRMEYAEKRLQIAIELEQQERAIAAAGGKEGFKGAKEVETITKDTTNIKSARDVDVLDQKRADMELERSLEWEYRDLRLQDEMDLANQLYGLERLAHEEKMTQLEQDFVDEKLTWDQYYAAQVNEYLRHGQKMKAVDRQIADARLANQMEVVSGMGDLMGELYSISGEKVKAFFYAQKAMVVTEMIMNAYRTWASAMATPNVSPLFNIPMANIMLAMGLAKAGLVAGLTVGQGVKGFAQGGEIQGYSPTTTADNVPIMATAGEFMQPVPTVQYYGKGVMEALRTRSIPREALSSFAKSSSKSSSGRNFAEGGSVESIPEKEKSSQESVQIVNILDPAMFDQYVSSHAGQKALMNVISRNPAIIKNAIRS